MKLDSSVAFLNFSAFPILKNVLNFISQSHYTILIDYGVKTSTIDSSKIHKRAWYHRHELSSEYLKLEPKLFSEMELILKDIYVCSDRVFVKPISYLELRNYSRALLKLIYDELNQLQKFQTLICGSSPHFPWDVAIAKVSEILGVSIFILRTTQINNHLVITQGSDASDFNLVHFDHKTSYLDKDELESSLKSNLVSSRRLKNSKKINSMLNAKQYFVYVRFIIWQSIFNILRSKKIRSLNPLAIFQPDYILNLTQSEFYNILRILNRKNYKLKKVLRSQNLTLQNLQFIYFPLHYQPERTTIPEAGNYDFQLQAIRRLESYLETRNYKDIKIVVKEHPRQLKFNPPHVTENLFRDESFYESLRNSSRILLVNPDYDENSLLRDCVFTATCTGSSAWQSLFYGKPSISFAKTWHSSCKSSPYVQSDQDIDLFFSNIPRAKEVKEDVRTFLTSSESFLVYGVLQDDHIEPNLNLELMVRNISNCLLKLDNNCTKLKQI